MRNTTLLVITTITILTLTGCVETVFKMKKQFEHIRDSEILKTQALQGDAEAQYHLGKLNCCGEYPEFDNVEALRWWCKAAKNDQRDAMLEVGTLYETSHQYKGSIIPRNNIRAYVYYNQALINGNDDAQESVDRMKAELSDGDMKTAQYISSQWPDIGCEVVR